MTGALIVQNPVFVGLFIQYIVIYIYICMYICIYIYNTYILDIIKNKYCIFMA